MHAIYHPKYLILDASANCKDSDHMLYSVAFDQGQHCLLHFGIISTESYLLKDGEELMFPNI